MAEKLLDFNEALDRLGGDAEFLTELLYELLSQIDQNFSEIKNAIVEKKFDELKSLSHSLKGASANLNVNRLASRFLALEDLGAAKSVEGANEILELIAQDKNELKVFLSQN
ncbi:MAG: Hpt domain-containing protein [Calditrichae bacterium]|nr:Hpt domain-containing protein [Calditrichota bacterium]MCB9059073.1 Hpt domain-containing protein [Calditrichia bacterium]